MKEKGVKERKRENEKESDEKGRRDGGRAERTGKSFRQRCWMHGRRDNVTGTNDRVSPFLCRVREIPREEPV